MDIILETVRLINLEKGGVAYHYIFKTTNRDINILIPRSDEINLLGKNKASSINEIEVLLTDKARTEDKLEFERAVKKLLNPPSHRNAECRAKRKDEKLEIEVLFPDNFPTF
ncbi:MAG: hypothetical protein K2Q34_05855 [Alphaproteobacteria bacterium]|nr:hypothetical protein [Alphaproteobacteria bacterium]